MLMQAVQILLVLRERLHSEKSQGVTTKFDDSATGESVEVDRSSKHVCALPDTKRDIWAELEVDKSQRMVTTPRENVPAWRGGGRALNHKTTTSIN